MVHNGIEYGDMQLIAEGYSLLQHVFHLTNDEMASIFQEWNKGEMESFLVEITGDILGKRDEEGKYLIDVILDSAGQKGTGKWTAINALDHGIPVTLIGEAVFARCLSSQKEERVNASKILKGPIPPQLYQSKEEFISDLKDTLYAAKLVSYAQGFVLLREASTQYSWDLQYGAIAAMWRGGCIIRSRFLNNIKEAFDRDSQLPNLLLDPFFRDRIHAAQDGWRRVSATAIMFGIAIPAISTALAYYDGYRTADGSANLIQAQRDYFGAHTFRRKDRKSDEVCHFNWTGRGGETTAGVYLQ
jgi:6-phosphogluconate dehydrogenase